MMEKKILSRMISFQCIAIVLLLFSITCNASEENNQSLQLTIKPVKEIYRIYDAQPSVVIECSLKNIGNKDIYLPKMKFATRKFYLEFNVIDPTGKSMELEPGILSTVPTPSKEQMSIIPIALHPGDTVIEMMDLRRLDNMAHMGWEFGYKMNIPGEYEVKAKLEIRKIESGDTAYWSGLLNSNVITVKLSKWGR